MDRFDTIYKNATLVNHDGEGLADIAVKNGKIVALGDVGIDAKNIINCQGLHILPGVIDTQVHFREPGLEHKENLQSGSLSAVMGGRNGRV